MHFVAVWAENDKVFDVVVVSIAVNMSNFQNLRDSKTAIRTNRRIVVEGQFPVVDSLDCGHRFAPARGVSDEYYITATFGLLLQVVLSLELNCMFLGKFQKPLGGF